ARARGEVAEDDPVGSAFGKDEADVSAKDGRLLDLVASAAVIHTVDGRVAVAIAPVAVVQADDAGLDELHVVGAAIIAGAAMRRIARRLDAAGKIGRAVHDLDVVRSFLDVPAVVYGIERVAIEEGDERALIGRVVDPVARGLADVETFAEVARQAGAA